MNVQKEERMEDLLEQLMGGEEGEIVEDLFDKIEEQEQDDNEEEEVSSRVLKIVTNKCLLRKKDSILNLLEREGVCKKIEIYWWIKMRV